MKKILTLLLVVCCFLGAKSQTTDPVANPAAVVQSGNMRFTVLTPQMIRIQYSSRQLFEDRATFAVVNRNLPVPKFTTNTIDGYLYIVTEALTLKYKVGSVPYPSRRSPTYLSITFNMNGQSVIWYPGKDDAMNLKGTTRTLDNDEGDSKRSELENGLVSRAGWAIIDESPATKRGDGSTTFAYDKKVNGIDWVAAPVDGGAYDWYFLGYGHDYKAALGDFTKVAGRQPMPPLYVMGYWYSKYQKYTAQDFMNIVNDINTNDIPLDVMIFDMDWHLDGWTGWTWNKSIIPNPAGLISWMHAHKLKVSLNLHPADGVNSYEDNFANIRNDMKMSSDATNVPWQLEDSTFYKTMFKNIIRLRESEGVDFWWLDWQQNLTNPRMSGLGETFWCNHVFYNDMRLNRTDRRPVIFHRWGGLGSHRYPIGFSGDTFASFGTLAFEPYFTSTASNVGFGYWGHDLGGHQQVGDNNPELYLRWMQFGVFTPIFRTHATNASYIERRIWKFDNFPLLRETVLLRYSLMPYIYTAARQAYDTGVSICRPLYYDNPEENNAYRYEDEYMFGDDILVAPVVTAGDANGMATRKTWLPDGKWFDVCRNKVVNGDVEFIDSYDQNEIPYFFKAGSVIVNNPKVNNLKSRPESLIIKVVPGADGSTSLYEDNGDNEDYKSGAYTTTAISQTRTNANILLNIYPRSGYFVGMPTERAYSVEFLAEDKPEGILINGDEASADSWSFDEMTKTVTVKIPKTSCDAAVTVTVKRNPTGIANLQNRNLNIRYDSASDAIVANFGSVAGKARLSIVNLEGAEVANFTVAGSDNLVASLASLPQDGYICRLNVDGDVVSRKILK